MFEVDAGILIGGKSKRFGQDKASLQFGNCTLLERIYFVLKEVVDGIWIIGNKNTIFDLPSEIFINDTVINAGPMGGLLTALKNNHRPTLLLSCDMPFINQNHVKYLLDHYDSYLAATVAVSEKGIEPLFAIYQPHLIPLLEELISGGNFALYKIFNHKTAKFVDFSKAGYDSNTFFNINTLSDYKKALYLRKGLDEK